MFRASPRKGSPTVTSRLGSRVAAAQMRCLSDRLAKLCADWSPAHFSESRGVGVKPQGKLPFEWRDSVFKFNESRGFWVKPQGKRPRDSRDSLLSFNESRGVGMKPQGKRPRDSRDSLNH